MDGVIQKQIEQIHTNTAYTQSILATLHPGTAAQYDAIETAQADLAEWEKVDLHKVREVFE